MYVCMHVVNSVCTCVNLCIFACVFMYVTLYVSLCGYAYPCTWVLCVYVHSYALVQNFILSIHCDECTLTYPIPCLGWTW